MFNSSNAHDEGKKGGQAKTARKQRASRANGKKGGRPTSRTFVEQLLNQALAPNQLLCVAKAYTDLYEGQKQELHQYFDVPSIKDARQVPAPKLRRLPKRIRYLLQRFKLAAAYHLETARPPSPYVREWKQRDEQAEKIWKRSHPDVPCPYRQIKTDIRRLPNFKLLAWMYSTDPKTTTQEFKEVGGGVWHPKRLDAAMAWFRVYVPVGVQDMAALIEAIKPHMTD